MYYFNLARLKILQASLNNEIKRERNHFAKFYANLSDRQNIYYLYFTTGYLQYVRRSLSLLPENLNVVLVGGGLTREEKEWIAEYTNKPYHFIPGNRDCNTILDFLFTVNESNFGWISYDFILLNNNLIFDFHLIKPQEVMRSAMTFPFFDLHLVRPVLLFFNIEAIRSLKNEKVLPGSYTSKVSTLGRFDKKAYSNLLSPRHKKAMSSCMPIDNKGNPVYPHGTYKGKKMIFFDILSLFQLLAKRAGYETSLTSGAASAENKLRNFHAGLRMPFYDGPLEMLDFLLPAQPYSYHDINIMPMMDYFILYKQASKLPNMYQGYVRKVRMNLKSQNFNESEVIERIHKRLSDIGTPTDKITELLS